MREIKFRAWDAIDKTMFMPDGISLDGGAFALMFEDPKLTLPKVRVFNGPAVLMQYTGLKDKNGVDIYEGDIVKAPYFQKDQLKNWTVKIYFADGAFMFTGDVPYPLCGIDANKLEVVGNIYENPELLQ